MLIQNIQLTRDDNLITLSADVQFHGERIEKMYFSTDKQGESAIFVDGSPFLAAVLLPCMKIKEDIVIHGSVSQQLLQNTEKIMGLIMKWDLGLHKVKITADNVEEDTTHSDKVASFFSAGVDSFYTFLQNRKVITDLLFVHGFDVPLANTLLFSKLRKIVSEVAQEAKVHAVFVKTNVAEIIEKKLIWDFAHGGALAAVALFLRNGYKHVFISGAVRKDELFPYGTHPDLDYLWSTERLKVSHEGTEANRLEKITAVISHSPLALKYLHVCTQNLKGKYNCSKCYKCLTTMIYFVCADCLDKAETFDKKIDLDAVKNMYYDYSLAYNRQGEASLALLQKQNKASALQAAIAESLEKSKHRGLLRSIGKVVATFDQKYNNRRLYRFIFSMNSSQDRNIFFKFFIKKKLFK